MSKDVGQTLPFSWAATLLLYSGDIGRHLKEFDGIFPGQGRQLPIEHEQHSLLGGESLAADAADAANQPVETGAIMVRDRDKGFQAGRILTVFDVCDV